MKIAFALLVHYPDDERVWFQEAKSLKETGNEVFIISTRTNHCSLPDSYCFDDSQMPKRKLIKQLSDLFHTIVPDVIICDNPMAILAAQHYKKEANKPIRMIYDVTEWYPSKKNLRGKAFSKKVMKFFSLIFLSFYTSLFLDGFIFGEYHKAFPFRCFFPRKKFIYLPYYACFDQIKRYPTRDISKECIFLYSGDLTKEKGFESVWNVAVGCASRFTGTKFILRIISNRNLDRIESQLPDNLEIQKVPILPFLSFCEEIGKADFFFDLRKIDMESTRCLPIKLFYYMATGRPVIYSNLKAIRKGVPEINQIGILVNPKNTDTIVSLISGYLTHSEFYQSQCQFARQLAEQKYNWTHVEQQFVSFVLTGEQSVRNDTNATGRI
jgi:glycosyltransferase involved in cell wall biosynthesis